MTNLTKKEIEGGQIKNVIAISTNDIVFYKITYIIDNINYSIKFRKNNILTNTELNDEIYNTLLATTKIEKVSINTGQVIDFSSLNGQPITEPRKEGDGGVRK